MANEKSKDGYKQYLDQKKKAQVYEDLGVVNPDSQPAIDPDEIIRKNNMEKIKKFIGPRQEKSSWEKMMEAISQTNADSAQTEMAATGRMPASKTTSDLFFPEDAAVNDLKTTADAAIAKVAPRPSSPAQESSIPSPSQGNPPDENESESVLSVLKEAALAAKDSDIAKGIVRTVKNQLEIPYPKGFRGPTEGNRPYAEDPSLQANPLVSSDDLYAAWDKSKAALGDATKSIATLFNEDAPAEAAPAGESYPPSTVGLSLRNRGGLSLPVDGVEEPRQMTTEEQKSQVADWEAQNGDTGSMWSNPKLGEYMKRVQGMDSGIRAAYLDSLRGPNSKLFDAYKHSSDSGRQDALNNRQQKSLDATLSTQFSSQLEKDMKPLKDIISASSAVRLNLTPHLNASGQPVVPIGKAYNIISFAARALGNVGMQTENDAARTLLPTLESKVTEWYAKLMSDPSYELPFDQVSYLLESINGVAEATRAEVADKIAATQASYVGGRGMDPDAAAKTVAPMSSWLAKKQSQFVMPTATPYAPPTTGGVAPSGAIPIPAGGPVVPNIPEPPMSTEKPAKAVRYFKEPKAGKTVKEIRAERAAQAAKGGG